MTFYEQTLGDSEKEKPPFGRKEHQAEPDSGTKLYLLWVT